MSGIYKRKELHLFRTWINRKSIVSSSKKCYEEYLEFSGEELSYEMFVNRVRDYKHRLEMTKLPKKVYVERKCPKCGKTYKTLIGRDGLQIHNRCLKCKNLEKSINTSFYFRGI